MAKKKTSTRNRFTDAQKEDALLMMTLGKKTRAQIAEAIGCSTAALTLWQREARKAREEAEECAYEEEETEDYEDEEYEEVIKEANKVLKKSHRVLLPSASQKDEVYQIIKDFWSKDLRGVEMFLNPKGASAEEVKELVGEAIQFAYDRLS